MDLALIPGVNQAQAAASATVSNGGTSGAYQVGDILTAVGGTGQEPQFVVLTLSGNQVATVAVVPNTTGFPGVNQITGAILTGGPSAGAMTVVPSNPVATTGGHGTGCTLTITWAFTDIISPIVVLFPRVPGAESIAGTATVYGTLGTGGQVVIEEWDGQAWQPVGSAITATGTPTTFSTTTFAIRVRFTGSSTGGSNIFVRLFSTASAVLVGSTSEIPYLVGGAEYAE